MRIKRNGTTLYEQGFYLWGTGKWTDSLSVPIVEAMGVGTYTYTLEVARQPTMVEIDNVVVKNRSIVNLEVKR